MTIFNHIFWYQTMLSRLRDAHAADDETRRGIASRLAAVALMEYETLSAQYWQGVRP